MRGQAASPYTADHSASTTRLPLTLQDTPQSISVITEQRIADQNLTNLRDVLDNTTGVSSTAYDSERVVFWSRGFQIENMSYDGVPIASSLNISSADSSLDTSIYERVEVIRGATGLLSGAAAGLFLSSLPAIPAFAILTCTRRAMNGRTRCIRVSPATRSWAKSRA